MTAERQLSEKELEEIQEAQKAHRREAHTRNLSIGPGKDALNAPPLVQEGIPPQRRPQGY